jgi:hypothetical protein
LKPLDLIGQKFGKLLVLSRAKNNSRAGKARFKCRCDCGYLHTAVGSSLIQGHSVSCGCYRKSLLAKAKIKPPGHVSYKIKYNSCKKGAVLRGLEFMLTEEEHKSLISMPCHYCGKIPQLYNPYSSPSTLSRKYKLLLDSVIRANINVNGIDRVDNNVGYVLSNCVPCCPECNEGKSDRPLEDFIDRAYRIVSLDVQRKKHEL